MHCGPKGREQHEGSIGARTHAHGHKRTDTAHGHSARTQRTDISAQKRRTDTAHGHKRADTAHGRGARMWGTSLGTDMGHRHQERAWVRVAAPTCSSSLVAQLASRSLSRHPPDEANIAHASSVRSMRACMHMRMLCTYMLCTVCTCTCACVHAHAVHTWCTCVQHMHAHAHVPVSPRRRASHTPHP